MKKALKKVYYGGEKEKLLAINWCDNHYRVRVIIIELWRRRAANYVFWELDVWIIKYSFWKRWRMPRGASGNGKAENQQSILWICTFKTILPYQGSISSETNSATSRWILQGNRYLWKWRREKRYASCPRIGRLQTYHNPSILRQQKGIIYKIAL